MTRFFYLAFVLSIAALNAQNSARSTTSGEPISAERMVIYQDFLSHYQDEDGSKKTFVLNLAQTTVAFEPESGDRLTCLKHFTQDELMSSPPHMFRPTDFQNRSIRIVDPKKQQIHDPGEAINKGQSVDDAVSAGFASAIFTLSEIVFDASHTHAAFSYSFHCGALCGDGGDIVYELKSGKWKKSGDACGMWIS